MIRCKLISPTNLMLEHPLHFANAEESEFFVIGRKEHERIRREWIRWGVLIGLISAVGATGVVSLVVSLLR